MRGKTKYYEYNGEKLSIYEWAAKTGLPITTLSSRLQRSGGDMAAALAAGRVVKKYRYKGGEYTATELAEMSGISAETLRGRLARMSVERAITQPVKPTRPRKGQPRFMTKYCPRYGCTRFDCLHQDGSGVCQDNHKPDDRANCEYFEDAFAYYYGGRKHEKETKAENDRWARDRQLLLCGIVAD